VTAWNEITVDTADHGPVVTSCPPWCTGDGHPDGLDRVEITHQGPPINITVGTGRGPRRLVELIMWQDPFPPASSPHGTGVYVVAHLLDGDHFGFDVAALEGLVTNLLEAAGRVSLVARRLASETRGGAS